LLCWLSRCKHSTTSIGITSVNKVKEDVNFWIFKADSLIIDVKTVATFHDQTDTKIHKLLTIQPIFDHGRRNCTIIFAITSLWQGQRSLRSGFENPPLRCIRPYFSLRCNNEKCMNTLTNNLVAQSDPDQLRAFPTKASS
jgi:hypothetical protein